MTHHLTDEQYINYIYQLLPDTEREEIDRHLSDCPSCRSRLADHEALQRRIHYNVAAWRRVTPASPLTFAAIAPHLKRTRSISMALKQSNQFIYGAVSTALVVTLGIGLYFLVSNFSRPVLAPLIDIKQPTTISTVVNQPEIKMTAVGGQPEVNATAEISQPITSDPIGEMKWKFETKRTIYSNPAVVDGVVYFGSGDHYLHALAAETGQEIWNFKTEDVIWSSPTVAGDLIYIGSKDQHLYAVNRQTGQEVWKFKTGGPVVSAPAVAAGLVYFGSGCVAICVRSTGSDQHLYAVDSQTGREVWKFKASGVVDVDPLVANGVVYFGSDDGVFYAVEAQTGQEKWNFHTDRGIHSSPVAVGGIVYFGSDDTSLYALNGQTGQQVWRFKTAGFVTSSPAVAAGLVYVGSGDHYFYAVDAATGQERWKFKTRPFNIERPPVIVNGVIYFVNNDGLLHALNSQTGQELGRFKANNGLVALTVVDGIIYTGGEDGFLYAIEVGK